MQRVILLIFLVINALNGVLTMSGYLYKHSSHGSRSVGNEIPNENQNCDLEIKSHEIIDNDHQVFSGNGYKYKVACNVNDNHSIHGDKYYVVDLVVYGPTKRVSKAWHEQYKASNGRNINMEKELSFYWLGYSTIICSVSKYNKAMNKFTKICQTNEKVFVKENPIFKNVQSRRPNAYTRISTKSKESQVFKPNNIEKLNITLEQNGTTKAHESINLTVRAMQYRDLYKANSDKSIITDNGNLIMSSKKAIIQPIVLALVFIFIFCVSIGTIAYLSYNQRLTQAYHTVTTKEQNTNSTDEVCLNKFGKRPKSYAQSELNEESKTIINQDA